MNAPELDLYKGLILDHFRNPRNRGEFTDDMRISRAYNPLCGDDIEVGISMTDDHIGAARFRGRACSICIASASIMTGQVSGRSAADAAALADQLLRFFTGEDPGAQSVLENESLQALTSVHRHAARKRCATLPWEALREMLAE